MKSTELLKEQSGVENTENSKNSNSENIEFNNQPIAETPLIARNINEKWFGTVGNYKATTDYESHEELEEATVNQYLQWKDVGVIIGAQYDYFTKEIEQLNKKIEQLTTNK